MSSSYQYRLLKHTIEIAYAKSYFYRKKFRKHNISPKDLKCIEDIKKFPFTTKEDLLNFNDEFLTKPKSKMIRVISSGGTTSSGKFVYLDEKGLENYLIPVVKGFKLAGLKPGKDIVANLFDIGITVAGLVFGVLGFQKYGVFSAPLESNLDPNILLNYIKQINANVIYAPTSKLFSLTEKLIEQGYKLNKLKIEKIIVGGALLTEDMRRFIGDAWGAEIFNVYSSTEAPRMGSECKEHSGFHIQGNDVLLIEAINEETGEKAKNEEYGEIVITTLKRDCMPLIRYKLNDLVKITTKTCKCGLRTKRIMPLIGRSEERVVFKNFYKLYDYQINKALSENLGIAPFWQMMVEDSKDKDMITIFIEHKKEAGIEKKIKEGIVKASPSLNKAIKSGSVENPVIKIVNRGSLERSLAYGKIKNRIVDKRKNKFY